MGCFIFYFFLFLPSFFPSPTSNGLCNISGWILFFIFWFLGHNWLALCAQKSILAWGTIWVTGDQTQVRLGSACVQRQMPYCSAIILVPDWTYFILQSHSNGKWVDIPKKATCHSPVVRIERRGPGCLGAVAEKEKGEVAGFFFVSHPSARHSKCDLLNIAL